MGQSWKVDPGTAISFSAISTRCIQSADRDDSDDGDARNGCAWLFRKLDINDLDGHQQHNRSTRQRLEKKTSPKVKDRSCARDQGWGQSPRPSSNKFSGWNDTDKCDSWITCLDQQAPGGCSPTKTNYSRSSSCSRCKRRAVQCYQLGLFHHFHLFFFNQKIFCSCYRKTSTSFKILITVVIVSRQIGKG